MKILKFASLLFSILVLGACAPDKDDLCDLKITSSDKVIEKEFDWAVRKALSCVMSGKTGVINSSENYGGEGDWQYIPCYKAGLPYRSAFYIRDFCHQLSGAHLLGLEKENAEMMKAFILSASRQRDCYPLWALNFDGSPYRLDYESDECFSRYVPAVFELVEKLYALYMWTGDRSLVDNSRIWNAVTMMMEDFPALHDTHIKDGVAEGSSTGMLGDGLSSYCDYLNPLIESGDGIASQYRAYLAYASLLEARCEKIKAQTYRNRAEELKRHFEQEWTIENAEDGFGYIRGLGLKAGKVGGFGFEGSVFIPLKGLADASSRTTEFLKSCDSAYEAMDSDNVNISSLTYLPDLFFSWNMINAGWKWTKKIHQLRFADHPLPLVGNNGNYPELAFTYISNVVENLLGFEPDAPHNAFSVLSRLPDEIDRLGVENIPFGNNLVSVLHEGRNCTTISHERGSREVRCTVRFYGYYEQISIDGTLFKASHDLLRGAPVSSVSIKIPIGGSVRVKTVKD
ncbi:MAG: hypothetical protein ACI3ZK_00775 [Candidatus Cryptobacteroides sp.]